MGFEDNFYFYPTNVISASFEMTSRKNCRSCVDDMRVVAFTINITTY